MSSDGSTPRGWRALPTLVAGSVRHAADDRVMGLGAEVAFFILLSLPPALLAILGTLGYVASLLGENVARETRDQVLTVASSFLTDQTIQDTVRPTVDQLLRVGRADVASLGVVLTLLAASRATGRMIEAVSIAYGQSDRRSVWKRRLMAVGMTVVTIVALIVFVPILLAGPRLVEFLTEPLGLAGVAAAAWRVLYWPAVGLVAIGLLASFYHLATPIRTPWRRDLPGAVTAAVLWLLGGLGLRVYLAVALKSTTYGPLASPIAILLWLYVTAIAVLVGAEVNAEIDKLWPSGAERKGDGEEAPRGEA